MRGLFKMQLAIVCMGVLWGLPVRAQAGLENCVLERWGYVLDPYEQEISAIEAIETKTGVVLLYGVFTAQGHENLAYYRVRPAFGDSREDALGGAWGC